MDSGGLNLEPQNGNSKLATTRVQPQPQYTRTHQMRDRKKKNNHIDLDLSHIYTNSSYSNYYHNVLV